MSGAVPRVPTRRLLGDILRLRLTFSNVPVVRRVESISLPVKCAKRRECYDFRMDDGAVVEI
eukprot:scaffold1150_cov152-Amphora_coffeaeformis.AAC.3